MLASAPASLMFQSCVAFDAVLFLSFLWMHLLLCSSVCALNLLQARKDPALSESSCCRGRTEMAEVLLMETSRSRGSTRGAEICSLVLGAPASPVTLSVVRQKAMLPET